MSHDIQDVTCIVLANEFTYFPLPDRFYSSNVDSSVLEYMLDSIWTVFDKILVVSSVEPPLEIIERTNSVGARIIMVKPSTFAEALKSSIENVVTPITFVISGDRPLIKPNVLFFIGYGVKNFDCLIPKWSNGQFDVFLAAYRTDRLKDFLYSKNGSSKFEHIPNLLENLSFVSIEGDLKLLDPELHSFIRIRAEKDIGKIVKIIKG
ncbi:MAG: hypothetical protein N3F64_06665 [Nitrososphaeria archaeon]|nr:hypothetical protein [Nitrososphaeria archaeon]